MSSYSDMAPNGRSVIVISPKDGTVKQYDRGPNQELLPTQRWPGLAPVYDAFDDWLRDAYFVMRAAQDAGVPIEVIFEGVARLQTYVHEQLDTLAP